MGKVNNKSKKEGSNNKKRSRGNGGGGVAYNKQGKKKNKNKQQVRDRGGGHHHGNNKTKKKHTWKSVRDKQRNQTTTTSGSQKQPRHETTSSSVSTTTSSTTLRNRMLERLSVARFRTLNADIDSTPTAASSSSSNKKPSNKSNPLTSKETFESYHTGFANASCSWKQNPIDLISEWIRKSVPSDHVIADFGCGAGKLATSVPNLTHSFDLHRLEGADHVTECDMRSVPLEDRSVHVAVFCLSLMGSDVTEYLVEARRVLVDGGIVKIAEAAARLNGDNMRRFCTGMHSIGFKKTGVQEIGSGSGKDHVFVILEFKKLGGWGSGKGKSSNKRSVVLGACVYKKR